MIWFNPLLKLHVNTSLASRFLQFLDKHFGQDELPHQLLNRGITKVSFSCEDSVKAQISATNNQKLRGERRDQQARCNCQDKDNGPVEGSCGERSVVYKATVKETEGLQRSRLYIGKTKTSFKQNLYLHRSNDRIEGRRNATALSKLLWR